MADDNLYRIRLSDILAKHGFSWVVDQFESQIATGREADKLVSEIRFASDPDSYESVTRRSSARLVTSEPYSDREKLEILLKSIDAALIQRSLIEQEAVSIVPELATARFITDTSLGGEVDEISNHQVNRRLIEDGAKLRSRVIDVLRRIREEISDR